jgi:hypothetical protein
MKAYGRGALLLFTAVTVVLITTITTLYGQSQVNDKAAPANQPQMTEPDDRLPVLDLRSRQPDDPVGPERRRKRNARYDNSSLVRKDDSYGIGYGATLIAEWEWELSPLPAPQSEVIVVGRVVRAGRAHLSNDKTGIYSEFPVTIEEVLKNASSSPLEAGGRVDVQRIGGVVHYPNGRKLPYRVGGQNMPVNGLRYVFFLNPAGAEQAYEVVTAFELREGTVFPLDAPDLFDPYKGMGQAKFFEQLRNAIGQR